MNGALQKIGATLLVEFKPFTHDTGALQKMDVTLKALLHYTLGLRFGNLKYSKK